MDGLERAFGLVERWKKRGVATPLFMTKTDIATSLDVYPVEFLTMREHHVRVDGEDVLEGLTFDREHLRLQLERELKGKILLLREHYLETEGRVKAVRELIRASVTAMISLFHGLLFLKALPIPAGRREIVRDAAEHFAFPADVFLTALDIRAGTDRLSERDEAGWVPVRSGEPAGMEWVQEQTLPVNIVFVFERNHDMRVEAVRITPVARTSVSSTTGEGGSTESPSAR
ncbi:MAG: hypothetical protein BWY59_01061 [Verrucomicrobia bacterium ADurb.Bin345]|nr:MAG: hypothetical protein BWY59_01061 [Verrucomicrobia bacterium ADurb.Bin345]